jgi:hypothetical protein
MGRDDDSSVMSFAVYLSNSRDLRAPLFVYAKECVHVGDRKRPQCELMLALMAHANFWFYFYKIIHKYMNKEKYDIFKIYIFMFLF